MKRSYMVAVTVTVTPTVYIEVIADSAADAVASIKGEGLALVERHARAFVSEARTDLGDVSASNVRVSSAGRAEQYHDVSTCGVCQRAQRLAKRGA